MTPRILADRLASLELLVLDVDGVLTDGSIIIDDNGVESKHFHVRDGSAIALWNKLGKRTAILSGRTARCVNRRAAELAITPVVQGASDKAEALRTMISELQIPAERVAFMGDDLADLPAMEMAGFSACPADAAFEVRASADLVSQAPGGRGAVREVVEVILKAQGAWPRFASKPREFS